MKNKMKSIGIVILIVGIIFLINGLTTKIPSKKLSYYSYEQDATQIDKVVGGDAYNYIIGAALTGGEIAGAKIQKAIYISIGALLIITAIIVLSFESQKNETIEVTNNNNHSDFINNKKDEKE